MKIVLMAGGRGSRLENLTDDIPKPMIRILNKPVLQYEIECLSSQGFSDFLITVSYKAEVIVDYFGNGSKFGVNIEYFFEKIPLGNAGALFEIKDKLSEDFILLNADVLFNIDFSRFISQHIKNKLNGGLVTILTHPNSHPYDSGIIVSDSENRVTKWLSKEEQRPLYYKNRVNSGLHIVNMRALELVANSFDIQSKVDLDRQILKPLVSYGYVYIYDSPEYIKDMGTKQRLRRVKHDLLLKIVEAKRLERFQRAVFVDRDGTINRKAGFLSNINDFELLPGVADAIRKLNEDGYLVIVVTNQPVIARGEVTVEELEMIHNKMETLLGQEGAYIDAIYYCPHHPDKGFSGEIIDLKKDCNCRKPKPGMILMAAKKFNIDLAKSWMIGDSVTDVLAGKNAGCKTALISNNERSIIDSSLNGTKIVDSLKAFVDWLDEK